MSKPWEKYAKQEREYTVDDQIRDVEASIDLKERAKRYWQDQMSKPWNNAKGTQRSYEKKN